MVAYYGNYTMLVNKFTLLLNMALDGVTSGIGNLVAEGNKANTMKVFWELMSIRYIAAGIMFYGFFFMTEPFISLWLGEEYVLNNSVLILLLIYLYLLLTNGVVYMYLHAHGLYGDVWAMWTEICINVSLIFIAGSYLGIEGLLIAKITSTTLILVLWKPYYLFKEGLKESLKLYWIGVSRYFLIFITTFFIGYWARKALPINPFDGWMEFVQYGVILMSIYIVCNIPLMYYWGPGMKDLFKRFAPKLKNLF